MNTYDVIVLGGGASGMMAAGRAGARGKRVLLIEKKRRLGEKLRITGGGRCNITNAEEDTGVLLKKYGNAADFLHSPFSKFGVGETFSFFETRGLPLKIEANKRAFPKTERAEDVYKVLETYLKEGNVEIKKGLPVTAIEKKGNSITGVILGGVCYTADSYIIATGGVSHPETGSTGDGFGWLKQLGHSVQDPTPTIVPLRTKESWSKKLSGVSLKDCKITFFANGERRFSKKGNVLLTHFGISGPLILNSAHQVADLLHEESVTAAIDTYPLMDLGILDKHISSVFDANKNKLLRNVFKEIAPEGTSEVLLTLVPEIDPDTKVHSVTKGQRRMLAEMLKALPLTIQGLMGLDRAVIADGGVDLVELDMRSMRSRRCENAFITGDLLHIVRPSGGYSLQLCWTTGYLAGENA
ncbi:NAD(P)/FAD-dependent oxidoreductase [Patescibacteria group bacterium]|nr:NAD(P)/FAD-dependent oxidoreductase [Patescibacteria group bacterium]MBU1500846.1 NAD(P)/FAD-dependent oxidoreductase [Patescibacteria group bacterium]MBU2080901.1 NAD(P)/FAD-dependent oxidoreductase [Patescibacteria group bacterium]MBU2124006.1 NAD(P)/FAD-dependent oxidoreductase [Patescibacteria group bacterium]MBU2194703.1 NAD(P)/FAD-dependent oxidoreductase [Patescibacteria group bacterium]